MVGRRVANGAGFVVVVNEPDRGIAPVMGVFGTLGKASTRKHRQHVSRRPCYYPTPSPPWVHVSEVGRATKGEGNNRAADLFGLDVEPTVAELSASEGTRGLSCGIAGLPPQAIHTCTCRIAPYTAVATTGIPSTTSEPRARCQRP